MKKSLKLTIGSIILAILIGVGVGVYFLVQSLQQKQHSQSGSHNEDTAALLAHPPKIADTSKESRTITTVVTSLKDNKPGDQSTTITKTDGNDIVNYKFRDAKKPTDQNFVSSDYHIADKEYHCSHNELGASRCQAETYGLSSHELKRVNDLIKLISQDAKPEKIEQCPDGTQACYVYNYKKEGRGGLSRSRRVNYLVDKQGRVVKIQQEHFSKETFTITYQKNPKIALPAPVTKKEL